MSVPHNQARYGERWDADRIAAIAKAIALVRQYVVISGGWAWHFMTPPGHIEYKHAHDHKDADLFIEPERLAEAMSVLRAEGYQREWTRHDGKSGSQNFYRYIRYVDDGPRPVKVMLDLFVERVPFVTVGELRVVEPAYLLTLYGVKHESEYCFSVQIARGLLAQGISPILNVAMGDYRRFIDE